MSGWQQWRTAIASGLILGLVVGIPYYSLPYFYDYFEHPVSAGGFGWSRNAIILGLPVGTLVTLVAGPLLARRVEPRTGVLCGALVCSLAISGFGRMTGSLMAYHGLWILYMIGWSFAGPMTHQVLLSRVFNRNRGSALAFAFFGLSLFGAASVACLARPLTHALGYAAALRVLGACILLAVPVAWWGLPRLDAARPDDVPLGPPPAPVLRSATFWLLTAGGTLTAAGIAGVNQHLKLILRERGFTQQDRLDEVFGWTLLLMLVFGALGRFAFAWSADRFPKRYVITVAFLLMLCALPLLAFVRAGSTPYLFAVVFGMGMSSDSLLTTLLAAERFAPHSLARAMAVLVPVNSTGQTWFPFVVSLLWGLSGSYTLPLIVISACILGGRILIYLVPENHGQPV